MKYVLTIYLLHKASCQHLAIKFEGQKLNTDLGMSGSVGRA